MTVSQRSLRAICHLHGFWWAAALLFAAVPASAQTFPFLIHLQQGAVTTTIANQSTISMGTSGIGKTATATLTLTNQSTSGVTINNGPVLSQSGSDFSATATPATPVTLNPGDSLTVALQFTAAATAPESVPLTFNYTQGGFSGSVQLTLLGAPVGFTVSYTMPPNQNTFPLAGGGTVQFPPTGINTSITATISIQNTSAVSGTISAVSIPSGAQFQLVSLPLLPATVNPGATLIFGVKYTPTQNTTDTGTLAVNLGGIVTTYVLSGSGTSSQSFTVSYTMPPNQNTTPVSAGGTVQFPATQINTSITAAVQVTNTGTSPGTVTAVSISSGSPFQLVSLGLLPATVNAGLSLVFGVKYSPTQVTTDTATLSITIGSTVSTYTLSGSGISSSYSYTMTGATGGSTTITPNTSVSFPDTALGSTVSFFIQVRNVGDAAGTINAINATGSFSVSDGPTIFPVTLNPNGQITFTLTFAPAQPGQIKGKLTVGNDVFDLVGNGIGPKLTFSYGSNQAILSGGTVIFSPAQVGQTSQVSFTITNAGTSTATITSIALADTKNVFKLPNPVALPASLQPNASLTFPITFAPALTGFATTILQIDTQSFTLSGSGTAPPALPDFQFTGTSGTVAPLQQPAVGLTLSSAYSLPLTGTLTISVNSGALAPDKSIQFATGGTSIPFTIPVNATQAVFPTGGNQIGLQVGTTASTITLTPTFATQSGLDLTPQPPPTLSLTIAAGAPKLLTIQVTNVSQAAFAVGITGLSTTRALSTLTYQFTPTGGGKPVSYSIDVAAAAGLWYSSSGSQAFGSQFSASVPFALPNPSTTSLATSGIKSISVTATNAQGTSAPVSLTLQ